MAKPVDLVKREEAALRKEVQTTIAGIFKRVQDNVADPTTAAMELLQALEWWHSQQHTR